MSSFFDYWHLTAPYFKQFKESYSFYGTHTALDSYGNEYTARDTTPRATIETMWHPLDDRIQIAEYGRDFDKVLYGIAYDCPSSLTYGDRVDIDGEEYEITALKKYNTHTRIDIKKKVAS